MRYLKPSSVGEAVDGLESARATILAGGTDLCVYMAEGLCHPEALIDISGVDSLRGVETAEGKHGEEVVRIGACTSLAEIAVSEALPTCLRQGARAVGSPQIRNLGTIGGNICNASPCGDTLAPLLALEARFVLRSAGGTRTVESGAFFTGPKQTVLAPNEILEWIEIPASSRRKASAFRMIGVRRGQAISQVNAAISLAFIDGGMSEVRAAVGSVAPVPLRLEALEALLTGKRIEDVGLADIEGAVLEGIRPIDDVRSSASYRQHVTVSLVFDAMGECAAQFSEREGAGGC